MKVVRLLSALLLAGFCPGGAAVIPYMNDFSGTGSNTAFTTEVTDAEWTVSSGTYVFNYTNTAVTPSVASISITNAANVPFTMETQFTVNSVGTVNSNGASIGFGAFGLTTNFSGSNATTAYYLADWQVANSGTPGNLRILALGDTAGFTGGNTTVDANPSSSSLAVILGTTYTMRLTGTYVGSTLTLTLGIYDEAGTIRIGSSVTASDTSPLTGTNFGYRNRIGIGGGAFNTSFDNFDIVPEPVAVGSLALGGLLVLARRCRTKTAGSACR